MKSKTSKIILIISICLFLALIAAVSVSVAYLTSKRKAEGYLNFASGIAISYNNVIATTANQYGNMQYVDDKNNNNIVDEGELKVLHLADIQPGQEIKFANPYLMPMENTASFALRAKLVVTDISDENNPVEYNNPEDINKLFTTTEINDYPVFSSGTLAFNNSWEHNTVDNWFYITNLGTGEISERLVEINFDGNLIEQARIYLFNADAENQNIITCTVIDDEPIEQLPVKSLKIAVYIEAIQYSSVDKWFN